MGVETLDYPCTPVATPKGFFVTYLHKSTWVTNLNGTVPLRIFSLPTMTAQSGPLRTIIIKTVIKTVRPHGPTAWTE